MNKNTSFYIAGGSLLLALVCAVSASRASSARKAAETEAYQLREQIARMKAYVPDMDAEQAPLPALNSNDSDTNDVEQLQALLAQKEKELRILKEQRGNRGRNDGQPRESWEDRMARMKEEQPEEYADMIKRREERQQQMRYKLAERTATFMDLDTSGMTEEERANHEELIAKMAKVWELTAQFQDPEAAPDREAMRDMYTQMREVRPMMDMERNVMFKQLATDVGYEGDDAEAFATHIEEIIGATSTRNIFDFGGRGGGRGGRGGGGR